MPISFQRNFMWFQIFNKNLCFPNHLFYSGLNTAARFSVCFLTKLKERIPAPPVYARVVAAFSVVVAALQNVVVEHTVRLLRLAPLDEHRRRRVRSHQRCQQSLKRNS